MKLKDFRYFDKELHCVNFIDDNAAALNWEVGHAVQVVNDSGNLVIAQHGQVAPVNPKDLKTAGLAAAQPGLWRLAQKGSNHLHLEYVGFTTRLPLDLKIAVDSYISTQLHQDQLITSNSIIEATAWLKQAFVLELEEPLLIAQYYRQQSHLDFKVIGKDHALSVVNDQGVWKAKRLTKLRRQSDNFIAIVGNVDFVDGTSAALLKTGAIDLLEQHINDAGSYLSLWESYSQLQWEQATRTAKALGYVNYSEHKHTGGETPRFRLHLSHGQSDAFAERINNLQKSDDLSIQDLTFEISEEVPEWLSDISGSFKKSPDGRRPLLASNLKFFPTYIEVDLSQPVLPRKGVIFLSIQGDKTANDRRERAYTAIKTHHNPMPQLRMIFEGLEPPIERKSKSRAISPKAKQRFKGEPTIRQRKALEIALNTPDVALIIGPPGTGKTQVIAALQQRIAEEFSSGESLSHQVLLTSFQHDAVDNVIERSGVFGLPAIKVGGRRFGNDSSEIMVTKWRLNKLLELKPALELEMRSWPVFVQFETIKKAMLQLRIAREPSVRKVISNEIQELLNEFSQLHGMYLSNETSDAWLTTYDNLNKNSSLNLSNSVRRQLLQKVRGIRSEIVAFNDDGFERLQDFLCFFESLADLNADPLISQFKQLYTKLNDLKVPSENQLQQLSELKHQMIDLVRPDYRPFLLRSYTSEADCNTLDMLERELYQSIANSRTLGSLLARYDYVKALEERALDVEDSIKDYVTVIGATCQQSDSEYMASIKENSERLGISFNTVIVDEAARAAPLDLMIPMSMAKSRIVLVGDHLQLPHMLEPRVEKELQEQQELDLVRSELLRISLFEYLHRQFKKMHEKGGPERVVMLDTQFRMHPELGSFVSKEFYERQGFEPIKSGLESGDFEHQIDGYKGCHSAWIDVPKSQGLEKRNNGSRLRIAEAKRCAAEAFKILSDHPDLSVGVITFYSAQRDAIYQELEAFGCAIRSDDGWQIAGEFRLTQTGDECLRVGSVDAFQGKEFDVVILSVVRTWDSEIEMTEEELNKKLGFLRLANRINVAMSRQKKLLIAVGDKELGTINSGNLENGMPLLPGFPAFYKLCEGPHGKVF
ncbi:DEAD/DEAH box helicase [Shewanella oncorhynchi]|uniref:DEAD/DEAH box helicase n=1 Tax=Shewanella oncorhynchi TaxID=2726434 RepID=UPI003D7BF6B0